MYLLLDFQIITIIVDLLATREILQQQSPVEEGSVRQPRNVSTQCLAVSSGLKWGWGWDQGVRLLDTLFLTVVVL